MQVELSPEFQSFVDEKIQSGAYRSVSEVMENAISRWQAEEADLMIDPIELRRLVKIGQEAADRGEWQSADEVFAELRARSAQRRKQAN